MALTQKNKRAIIGLTALLLLAGGFFFAWLQKHVIHDDADLQVVVYPLVLQVGDTLHFADRTPFAKQHRWDFGDSGIYLSDSGTYRYTQAGYYQVKLVVNNRYTSIVPVQVKERKVNYTAEDSLVEIIAPSEAMQFANIIFRCKALDVTNYHWTFGEGGSVATKEPFYIYAYQQPGDYTVMLKARTMKYPTQHHIKILPAYKVDSDSFSVDDKYRKIDDDFKLHLQQIADGDYFNKHYNYLLHQYLCNREKIIVKINGNKVNDFYNYCIGLRFDKHVTIQSVKCGFDDSLKCVTKVEVQQGK